MSCAWEYLSIENVDFDKTWTTVMEIILKNFAGDPVDGVPSPSVQNTIYLSQKDILAAIKEVSIVRSNAIFHPLTFLAKAIINFPIYSVYL